MTFARRRARLKRLPRKSKRVLPPAERSARHTYVQLWRLIDGALMTVIKSHPEYFRSDDLAAVRASIAKRVVGAILGYAEQSAQSRSGDRPAADSASFGSTPEPASGGLKHRHPALLTTRKSARRGRCTIIDPAILAAIIRDDERLREIAAGRCP